MRCYGCNSTSHLIKDCMVIHRPEETKLELKNVVDITERVQSLNKFAIFITRDPVDVPSLRAAVMTRFSEFNCKGKIIPIDKHSFLVGFLDECHRDYAVLVGKINFGDFSGTFYEWNENWGASKVCTPVFVWITLEGLPLQCWGKEEVRRIISSFANLHKIGKNLFHKTRADVVKVMVEVEDISLIPRVIQCSYKAITDNRLRFFDVKLIPSTTCLPVSQCTEDNLKSFEEQGGSADGVEAGWGGSCEVRRVRELEPEAADLEEVEQVLMRSGPGQMNARYEVKGQARSLPEILISQARAQEGDNVHTSEDLEAAIKDRTRKGKGIECGKDPEPRTEDLAHRPDNNNSGSGSCDPFDVGVRLQQLPRSPSPDDVYSRAGPGVEIGASRNRPLLISEGSEQDVDMGGEGGMGMFMVQIGEMAMESSPALVTVETKRQDRGPRDVEDLTKKACSADSPDVEVLKNTAVDGRSGSFPSVPPGFQRILKRSDSAASSGIKSGCPLSVKKKKPKLDVGEVVPKVLLGQPLTDEHIGGLKSSDQE